MRTIFSVLFLFEAFFALLPTYNYAHDQSSRSKLRSNVQPDKNGDNAGARNRDADDSDRKLPKRRVFVRRQARHNNEKRQ